MSVEESIIFENEVDFKRDVCICNERDSKFARKPCVRMCAKYIIAVRRIGARYNTAMLF